MKQADINEDKLRKICSKMGVSITLLNPRSFRLSKAGKKVDYYSKSSKCFWLDGSQEWGEVEDIEAFVKHEFS